MNQEVDRQSPRRCISRGVENCDAEANVPTVTGPERRHPNLLSRPMLRFGSLSPPSPSGPATSSALRTSPTPLRYLQIWNADWTVAKRAHSLVTLT
jgi:hypothetical protein